MRLEDKVAIITGAGQGIGLAYAERFLEEGAKVVIAELHDERGQAGLDALDSGGRVSYVQTDVADPASAHACVEATVAEFGRIDILVNNAATYMDLELSDHSLDYAKQVFDVNVHGQWIMAEAVAPTMVEQSWGRIINQASAVAYLYNLSALAPGEFEGLDNYAYQHSKWSVVGLTKFMAGQLGPYNVTVNAIAPGLTFTEATKKIVPDAAQGMFMMMQPIKRELQAEDMTGPAVFFASEDSAMVSGQLLCVDGGMTMPA